MNVLMLHNRYQIPGGEGVSTEMQVALLRSHGHSVTLVEESNDRVNQLGTIRTATRAVWSRESHHRISDLLEAEKYDVMHVQNFFPLFSPSVYYAASDHDVPVVQSLRNFRLVCPEGMLHRDGRVCTDCVGKAVAWPGVVHACYRGSRPGTAVVAGMSAVHKATGTWRNKVDLYVTPSQYTSDMYRQGGFDDKKLASIPNFVHPDPGVGTGRGDFALFVGRLAPSKGIDILLRAWEGVDFPLRIAGDGPLRETVELASAENPSVSHLGAIPQQEASDMMGEAAFVVVPTTGIETFGRVAAEALAKGTPAIVANHGGLAEIVEDEVSGLVFEPGDADHLIDRIQWMMSRLSDMEPMRAAAREAFVDRYTGDAVIGQWMAAYESVQRG